MPTCRRRLAEHSLSAVHPGSALQSLAVACYLWAVNCGSPLHAQSPADQSVSAEHSDRPVQVERPDSDQHHDRTGITLDDIPAKVRRFAGSTIDRYDTSGDGRLNKSEWTAMGGDPGRIDRDGDGVLTPDEYRLHLVLHHGSGRLRTVRRESVADGVAQAVLPATADQLEQAASNTTSAESVSTGHPAGPPAEQTNRARRFYVAPTRIPAATPQWFLALDRDGDAQLSLQEFLAGGRTLESFRGLDHSGDGIVTAAEAIGRGARRNTALNPEPD